MAYCKICTNRFRRWKNVIGSTICKTCYRKYGKDGVLVFECHQCYALARAFILDGKLLNYICVDCMREFVKTLSNGKKAFEPKVFIK